MTLNVLAMLGFIKKMFGSNSVENSEEFQMLSKMIEMAPTSLPYQERGLVRCRHGDFKGALLDFSKAIELEPLFVEAYANRGIANANLGNFNDAIWDFNKAIILDDANPENYYNRGNVKGQLFASKKYAESEISIANEAIQDYTIAIKLKPDFAEAYFMRGINQAKLGERFDCLNDMAWAHKYGHPKAAEV
ncbi:MAG TPA: tetratricopeptide repeat protein, partial [Bacteroidia bacterium]|nr:tetratricopeptide repeat protein [Bacteroidia bacterium]